VFSESLGSGLPDRYNIAKQHSTVPFTERTCMLRRHVTEPSLEHVTGYSVCCLFVAAASVTSVAEVPYRRIVECAVDYEWEGMWKERVVGKCVSLRTFPDTSDRNHKTPVSRCSCCRGSSLRNCCL
jgi:hypothetical protein